jgi:predicted nucleic acid-binding protein
MRLVVTDASIFFDLIKIEALDLFFQLDLEFHTSAIVMDECRDADRVQLESYVQRRKLHVADYTKEELHDVEHTGTRKGLSPADRSVLYTAKQLSGIVLTSDRAMRLECEEMSIECHGSLWCVKELHEKSKCDAKQALGLLRELQRVNLWLPKKELEELIKELGG